MQRHIKSRPDGDYQEVVPPGTMKFLDFARLRLSDGRKYSGSTGTREAVLDVFSGSAGISIKGSNGKQEFTRVGSRADVFAGPPVMVYIPPHSSYEVSANSPALDAGIFSAPSNAAAPPVLLEGAQVTAREVGNGNWQRTVYSALDQNTPAERLLAGETL